MSVGTNSTADLSTAIAGDPHTANAYRKGRKAKCVLVPELLGADRARLGKEYLQRVLEYMRVISALKSPVGNPER